MELDEAIKHCEDKAKELRKEKHIMALIGWEQKWAECLQCAEEYEQLAEWLTDYKRLKALEGRRRKTNRRPKCPNSHNCGDCVHAQGVWDRFTFRGFRCHKHCR